MRLVSACYTFDTMSSEQLSSDETTVPTLLGGTKLHIKRDADVSQLFEEFNRRFFWGKLLYVEVRWSPRMTSCAGLCVYNRRPGYCSIRLSRPLLSLRSKVDLVETILHEMIHAYLFVTNNNRDRDGHGDEFLSHMDRINKEAGLNISVFHTFHDEVEHYQQHVWLCNGPCQSRPPYFGKVHRSMNRAPGRMDYWWSDHQCQCGGEFIKIAEPQGYIPKLSKKRSAPGISSEKKDSSIISKDIRSFFKPVIQQVNQGCPNQSRGQHMSQGKMLESCHPVTSSTLPSDKESSNTFESNCEKNLLDLLDCSSSDNSSFSEGADEDYFGVLGAILLSPYRSSKRKVKVIDPNTTKVRKPNFSAMPKSKQGTLKNLIKVPNQPTLDNFYKKKKSTTGCSKPETAISIMKLSQRDTLKQPSVQSFLMK